MQQEDQKAVSPVNLEKSLEDRMLIVCVGFDWLRLSNYQKEEMSSDKDFLIWKHK